MKAQTLGRLLLGGFMVTAGVLHLTTQREEFRAQVPDWFPVEEDLTVLASGVVGDMSGASMVQGSEVRTGSGAPGPPPGPLEHAEGPGGPETARDPRHGVAGLGRDWKSPGQRVSLRCVTRCGRAASAPSRWILFFS